MYAPFRIPEDRKFAYWKAYDETRARLRGDYHKGLGKLWHKIVTYDMWQNAGFWIKRKFKKNYSWLSIPGGENCSSSVASKHQSGCEVAFNNKKMASIAYHGLPTEDVAPGHPGKFQDYWKELKPGDKLRKGVIIMHMKYDPYPDNQKAILAELWATCRSLPEFLTGIGNVFGDGIREEQLNDLGIPPPYCNATHNRSVDERYGNHLLIGSQDRTYTEKEYLETDIWDGMRGEQPKYRCFEPRFIYY